MSLRFDMNVFVAHTLSMHLCHRHLCLSSNYYYQDHDSLRLYCEVETLLGFLCWQLVFSIQ